VIHQSRFSGRIIISKLESLDMFLTKQTKTKMKYLFLLLLSVTGFNVYSQIAVLNPDSARLGNPAGTGTVALHGTALIKNIAEGNSTDSVLVRGNDGAVRFVKRSSFGALGILFSSGDNLPGPNYNGRLLFNTSLQKLRIYDATAGAWKDASPGGNNVISGYGLSVDGNTTLSVDTTSSNGLVSKTRLTAALSNFNFNVTNAFTGVGTVQSPLDLAMVTVAKGGTGLTTLPNGLLKSASNTISAAVSNADYLPPVSPVMTGTPTAPTAAAGTNTTQLATTAYVQAAVASSTGGGGSLNFNGGLTNNGGTISNNLITGISGGQELVGGTGPNDVLVIKGTSADGAASSRAVGINVGNNGSEKALSIFNDGNIGLGTGNHVTGNFQIGEDGSNGNLRYIRNEGASWFGIYDINNNTHYGFANSLGVPIANFAGLGGWYKGIGIMANVESGNGYPIFGVNTGDQAYGANGVGGNMFGVKADKKVTTFNNVLDDGNGGITIEGTVINKVLNGSQSVQTNANKELISIANTGTGNNVLSISPDLTGIPTAPTADPGTSSTQVATTEFVQSAVSKVTINTQTANYTLVLADAGKFIQQNVSSANNVTIPTNTSVAFPVGTQILIRQMGSGQVTIVAASGVTLQSADNALKSRAQFALITLIKVDTDTWAVMGDLTTAVGSMPDAGLMTGNSRITMPVNYSTSDNINWTQTGSFGTGFMTGLGMTGDGLFGCIYQNGVNMDWMLANANEAGNTDYRGFWFDNGHILTEERTGGVYSSSGALGDAIPGTFYGLRKTGTTIEFVSTLDGITYTVIGSWSGLNGYTYLRHFNNNFTLYSPQGVGITIL